MSTPMSTIKICSGVMLNNTYQHTIWFEDSLAQMQYFEGKVVKTFSSYSYLRKKWSIKVDATPEQAQSWTYLFFRNSNNGKVYFYFINSIEYINENTVELSLELDVMQTYAFDYTLARSFVEREHSASDEVGEHTLDEGLELGELVTTSKINMDMQEMVLLFLGSGYPIGESGGLAGQTHSVLNGVYSGLSVYAVRKEDWSSFALDLATNATFNDSIVTMWMYPKKLITIYGEWEREVDSIYYEVTGASVMTDTQFKRLGTVDGYIPTNKKLLTYPFNMMYVSNNAGGVATYRYERFDNPEQCSLRVCGAVTPEGATKLFPVAYNRQTINYEEGLMGASYPTCAWNQDVYKLWLAQNQNQHALALGSAGAQILAGVGMAVMTGGMGAMAGAGVAYNGFNSVMSILAQKADMQLQPPQSKGNYSSSVNVVSEHQTFTVMNKCVSAYNARVIDQFFTLYGYKCNLVKIPNTHVRDQFTYTKTVGCNVYGNLCMEDIEKIKSIFDQGITFWVNGDFIGNYALSNNCL